MCVKKMSLDKAIKFGKEKRKPYRGAKAVDKSCRNHGDCSYCQSNRMHKNRRRNFSFCEEEEECNGENEERSK